MEEQEVTRPLMSEEEFENNLKKKKEEFQKEVQKGTLFLRNYYCIQKFKSVRRAIKRGHVSVFGDIYPSRPFNNRTNTSKRKYSNSRTMNELKKRIYGELKRHRRC